MLTNLLNKIIFNVRCLYYNILRDISDQWHIVSYKQQIDTVFTYLVYHFLNLILHKFKDHA